MLRTSSPAVQSVIIALIAYASFSHGDVLTKFLTRTYSVSTCLAFGGLIGLIVSAAWIYLGRGWSGFKPPQWKIHLGRAFIVALSSKCAVGAISLMPLPAFYGIIFLAPICVVVLTAILGHEKFYTHRFITTLMGFVGVMIIIGTQFEKFGMGAILALGCVALTTISVLMIRKIGKDDYLPVYCFFPFLTIVLTNAPTADWHIEQISDAFRFLLFGIFIIAGHICIPLSYAKAPQTSLVAPIYYTQMLWGIVYGYIFFHQTPSANTLIGSALIIGGGLLMIWIERRQPRAALNTGITAERD